MPYLKTSTAHRGKCFICNRKQNLRKVKLNSVFEAWRKHKIVINHNILQCSRHTDQNGEILSDQFHFIPYTMKFYNTKDISLINRMAKNDMDIFQPFRIIETLTNDHCKKITGWTKEQFIRFNKFIFCVNDNKKRSLGELVAIYRYWLRKGIDQTSIAMLKSNTTQQQISQYLRTIRTAINKDFVPFFLGANKSRNFFIQHNHDTVKELHQLKNDDLAIFADATYCRIEKSADNQFQSDTYSVQKSDLLIKPFIICCADGYFIDIYGPYAAKRNDAAIFDHVINSDIDLRNILEANKTVCFLDRGL
jgi:hypothetical protein